MAKGILKEGTTLSNRPTVKGQNGPGFDPYPPEYAKLVNAYNNGMDSVKKPQNPTALGDRSPDTGNHPYKTDAKSYAIGGNKQPKVKEGP